MENLFIIIPARLKSTRLPNKVLKKINGKSLVENIWEGLKEFPNLFIATDSEEIVKEATKFNAKVILTNQNHNNGTERCAEVAEKLNLHDNDIIINVQCDELNINTDWIVDIYKELSNSTKEIITTVVTKLGDQTNEFWNNYNRDPSNVQVLLDSNNIAQNFKRATKNIIKNIKASENLFTNHHIGIYGYRKKTLSKISKLSTTKREKEEKLEQLRWLEHGVKIKCINTKKTHFGYSINTKEDLERLKNQNIL
tara:strand:- start:604 stop:1362 length:759 start_codon:yes stop_codon:yes gene_type:complete